MYSTEQYCCSVLLHAWLISGRWFSLDFSESKDHIHTLIIVANSRYSMYLAIPTEIRYTEVVFIPNSIGGRRRRKWALKIVGKHTL